MPDLVIRNATVLVMDPSYRVLPGYDVSLTNGLITSVAPTGAPTPASTTIDATGQFLLPGLVNTHTHVGQAYFKGTTSAMELFKWLEYGWFYLQRMSQDDIYWAAQLNILEMIRSGVTTFCDMFFYEDRIAGAVQQAGLRACLGEGIMEGAPGMAPRMPIDDQIAYARDVYKKWNGAADDRIRIFMAPHSPYLCSASTMEKVLAAAQETGTRISIHLSETRYEIEQAQKNWGMSPPERLEALGAYKFPTLSAHCVHLSDHDVELLNRPDFGIAHNPASNLKLQSGRAPIERLVGRKVAVGLGTDGSGSNDAIDLWRDLYLAAVLHPWTEEQHSAHTVLGMATREGARALGLDDDIGTIEVGKKADLILVSPNSAHTLPVNDPIPSLVYTARGGDVVTTIVDGRILMRDRQVLTMDEAEVLGQAKRRASRIFGEPYRSAR